MAEVQAGPRPSSVTPSKAKHLRNHAEAAGAGSGSVDAREGAKKDSNTPVDAWLDGCPISLTDDQRTRVMGIIEGDGGNA